MELTDWKDKLAEAFNIDRQDIQPDTDNDEQEVLPSKQNLKILLDKKNRKGKTVTLIVDFIGSDEALKALAKELKAQCGAGGSARDGEILIQGDVRQKVLSILQEKGYKARII